MQYGDAMVRAHVAELRRIAGALEVSNAEHRAKWWPEQKSATIESAAIPSRVWDLTAELRRYFGSGRRAGQMTPSTTSERQP